MRLVAAISIALFACSSAEAQTPKVVIEGIVINAATQAPVAGARLRLVGKGAEFLSHPDVEPMFTKTDAAGRFVFVAPGPDLFILNAQSPGAKSGPWGTGGFVDLRLAPTPVEFAVSGPETSIEKSTDRDGTLRAKVTISLSFYATIDGKVTSPDGLPMEGCLMEMFQEAPPGLDEHQKNSALRIPGTQKEVFRMPVTLSTDDLDETTTGPLVVTLGSQSMEVRGKLLDAKERPVAGVLLALISPQGIPESAATTTADGSFRMTVWRAGEFRWVSISNEEEWSDPDYLLAHAGEFPPLEVAEGQNPEATLHLTK
jgi:hypothetical protein